MEKKMNCLFKYLFLIFYIFTLSNQISAESAAQINLLNEKSINNAASKIITEQKNKSDQETDAITNTNAEQSIFLNFENASLRSVINYLTDLKNLNLLPYKDLDNFKVTLTTHSPLTIDQAWKILLTLCESSGFRLVIVDNICRVVPIQSSQSEPLPIYSIEPQKLPNSDVAIRYIYLFKNIKAENVKGILEQMLAQNSVQYISDLNACIITEKSLNIKAAMKIVEELDQGGLRESIQILKLNFANAQDVEKLFKDEILGGNDQKQQQRFIMPPAKKEITYFSKATKIIADPRNNNLFLLGLENNLIRLKNFIEKYIDVPLEAPESRLRIKELKYSQAEVLLPLLRSILEPPKDSKATVQGKVKYFEDVVIAAEADTEGQGPDTISIGGGNRLLIACNKEDWIRIEKLIDKLDKPRAQVAIEVLVVEHVENDNKELATQWHSKTNNELGTNVRAATFNIEQVVPSDSNGNDVTRENLVNIPASSSEIGDGAAFLTLGRSNDTTNNIWLVAKSLLKTNKINIVSQPFVITQNRQTGKLTIEIQKIVPGEVEANNVTPVSQNVPISASLAIELTPAINSDGLINLTIKTDVSQFTSTTTNGVEDRRIRSLLTRTSMYNGEVISFGGLLQSQVVEAIYKTPIFGDLPLIGNLFRGRQKAIAIGNLYVFIRPTIIKPSFDEGIGDYTQLKLDFIKGSLLPDQSLLWSKDPIQKWFFEGNEKPQYTLGSILREEENPHFIPIDEFAQGKQTPKSTKINEDPFYSPSSAKIITERNKIESELKKEEKKIQKNNKVKTMVQLKQRKAVLKNSSNKKET